MVIFVKRLALQPTKPNSFAVVNYGGMGPYLKKNNSICSHKSLRIQFGFHKCLAQMSLCKTTSLLNSNFPSNGIKPNYKNQIISFQLKNIRVHIEGWSQDCSKSDVCFFSQYLISSPWRRYEDYNISFCKQWKFRCHCSYEQWHLKFAVFTKGSKLPLNKGFKNMFELL